MSGLNRLIYKRQMEYVALNDSLGTDFPVVEDNKRRRMAFLEMLIEDLLSLKDEQPTLNENQQIVLGWLKDKYTGDADPFGTAACLFSQTPRSEVIVSTLELTRVEQAQVLIIFADWTLEQEED